MKDRSQAGEVSLLLVSLILVSLCFLGAAGFAAWAYTGRQDYKNNVDQKVSVAVAASERKVSAAKDKEFLEKEKNPLKTYTSSATNGSIFIQYPKTWSAYAIEGSGNQPLDAYFQPGVVPNTADSKNTFALHVELLNQDYSSTVDDYSSQVQQKQVTVRPYKAKNVSSVIGSRVDGQITRDKKGSVIILPLRDKTLRISTESTQFEKDFNGIILKHLKFSP